MSSIREAGKLVRQVQLLGPRTLGVVSPLGTQAQDDTTSSNVSVRKV